jgi:hypothetical protein
MPLRDVTLGEKGLLMYVFGAFTLPFDKLRVDTNDSHTGGERNSITPFEIAYMAPVRYRQDYSNPSVDEETRAIFIHEMTHVWQFYHDYHKIAQAVWQYVSNFGDYSKSYIYDVSASKDFDDYNMEQQAAIVQDWWRLTHNLPTKYANPPVASFWLYDDFLYFIRASGPPQPESTGEDLANGLGQVLANSF